MPEDLVDLLWVAFSAIWGGLWVSRYGESDDGTWLSVIRRLSPRQVVGGIDLIRHSWDRDFPPTPAQFSKWARDSVRPYDEPVESRAQLEHLKSSPERSARGVADLRSILAGGGLSA